MISSVSSLRLSHVARWFPLVGLLAAVVLGRIFGIGIGLLAGAATAMSGGIWLFWSSLQKLSGEVPLTLDEALSLGAPSAEEEQKRAVLRALKDLDYERAVGKISDADYTTLSERYRQEAKRLLRAVERDLTPERERAEHLLEERLAQRRKNGEAKARGKASAEAAAKVDAPSGANTAESSSVESNRAESEHGIATRERPAEANAAVGKGAAPSVEDHE
jgi:hypothetical protein